MTITPYVLDTPDPTDPLSSPSHAGQHTQLTNAVNSLGTRMGAVETTQASAAADITQARRVADTWVRVGTLVPGEVLLPVLWNLSPRAVTYEAAIASVQVAPQGGDIEVDIRVGRADPNDTDGGSIFKDGLPLVIPDGEYFSAPFSTTDFITPVQDMMKYLQVVVRATGPGGGEGGDLTVQLNRLL